MASKLLLSEWLQAAQAQLVAAGIATARLDTLVLLEDCLRQDRAQLLAHSEIELTAQQLTHLAAQLKRRGAHEPLAYIRGHSEFYGRKFMVDARVLVPRPESETIVELLKQVAPVNATIADIGSGSGALAITAALELPAARVFATDISDGCLAVGHHNAQALGADIQFVQGNLLDPLLAPADILLCNLPYVPDDYPLNDAAQHEPVLALFGGWDGLDLYRQLFLQLAQLDWRPELILTESLPPQHTALAKLALNGGYDLGTTIDFVQQFRRVD